MIDRASSKFILIIFFGFGLSFGINRLYFKKWYYQLVEFIDSPWVAHSTIYLLVGIPVFLSVIYLHDRKSFFRSLGLSANPLKGFALGLLATLPMLIGYGLSFKFNDTLTLNEVLVGSVNAAFFEELYYRGFLFGMMYRYTRLGFLPSVIFCAFIFGSVHIYQSEDIATMAGIFFTTFMGAGLFAWLYAEWEFNLWVPIGLHFFMNLFWALFAVSGNALGGLSANAFRIATIVLVIVGTVIYKLKNQGLEINRSTIWIRPQED